MIDAGRSPRLFQSQRGHGPSREAAPTPSTGQPRLAPWAEPRVVKVDLRRVCGQLVDEQPDATTAELHQRLGGACQLLCRGRGASCRLGLTFKKKTIRCQRGRTGRTWPSSAGRVEKSGTTYPASTASDLHRLRTVGQDENMARLRGPCAAWASGLLAKVPFGPLEDHNTDRGPLDAKGIRLLDRGGRRGPTATSLKRSSSRSWAPQLDAGGHRGPWTNLSSHKRIRNAPS